MSNEDQGSAGRSGESGQTGQEFGANPGANVGANMGTGPAATSTAAPAAATAWYCRPLFWSGFLLAAILAILGWLAWQAWQMAEADRLAREKILAQAREANLAREDFIQQLKLLLQADPCDLPAEMAKLTPPPGIIWPPLGSGRLPENILPDSVPDQPDTVDPAPTLPGQIDTGQNGTNQNGTDLNGTDQNGTWPDSAGDAPGQAGPFSPMDLKGQGARSGDGASLGQTDRETRSEQTGDESDSGSFEPGPEKPDLPDAGSQRPENEARPGRPEPARGMRI